MSVLSTVEVDQIVRQYQFSKLSGDMLDAQEAIERMLAYEQPRGLPTPWPYLHERFELRQGELTLVAGANGSGKSMLTGQMVAWAIAGGERCFLASFEMSPIETIRRMVTQCAGCEFTPDYARWWGESYRELLWLWDVQDVVPAPKVLERIEAVTQYLGARVVVIDSLLKCGLPQDGNGYLTGQTEFVDALQHCSKHLGVHIMLVAHLRKPERGVKASKYDIRGASQISDLADNVLLVHTNYDKREAEQALEQGGQLTPAQERALATADASLEVAKQRHGGWEGSLRLDLDKPSLRFTPFGYHGRFEWPGRKNEPA